MLYTLVVACEDAVIYYFALPCGQLYLAAQSGKEKQPAVEVRSIG